MHVLNSIGTARTNTQPWLPRREIPFILLIRRLLKSAAVLSRVAFWARLDWLLKRAVLHMILSALDEQPIKSLSNYFTECYRGLKMDEGIHCVNEESSPWFVEMFHVGAISANR